VAEQGKLSRKSGFRSIDDGVAFVGKAPVHHPDNFSSLFERGRNRLFFAADSGAACRTRIRRASGLNSLKNSSRSSRARRRVADGRSIWRIAGLSEPATHQGLSANFAELFKADRHNSSLPFWQRMSHSPSSLVKNRSP